MRVGTSESSRIHLGLTSTYRSSARICPWLKVPQSGTSDEKEKRRKDLLLRTPGSGSPAGQSPRWRHNRPIPRVLQVYKKILVGDYIEHAGDGAYQVLLLPIGMYSVTAEARGFRKTITEPQQLEINQALRIDVKMEIGSTTESVTVEVQTSTVDTVSATLGQSVTGAEIQSAPLNGRNVLDL